MSKFTISVFLVLSIASCATNTSSAANHERYYRGTYLWGPEVHGFKPCNDEKDYWVSFDWAGNEMHEYYIKADKEPYQPMYIEFRGQVLNEAVGGFAEEYTGLIRISEVSKYTFEVPAQCK